MKLEYSTDFYLNPTTFWRIYDWYQREKMYNSDDKLF